MTPVTSAAEPRPDWCTPARAFWHSVHKDYQLDDWQTFTLRAACDALDRAEEARATIAAEGTTFTTSTGMHRQHPSVQIERESRSAFLKACSDLRLEVSR